MAALRFDAEIDPRINLAAQQNDVPVVRRLELTCDADAPAERVEVRIEMDPELCDPWTARLEGLAPGATHTFGPIDLGLSTSALLERTERQGGHLVLTATAEGHEPVRQRLPIEVLAPNEWPGAASLPELLAAFVMPNEPALTPILQRAAATLEATTKDPSLDGYQSRDPARVKAIVRALYAAVQDSGLTYVNPPASFEQHGQKIRTPSQLMSAGMGTCLDLTVLFGALLEQVGLHSVLNVVDGHAFPGVWLHDFFLAEPATDDGGRVAKRVRLDEALVFDSSSVAPGQPFERAVEVAARHFEAPERFLFSVDVQRAGRHRIRSLSLDLCVPNAFSSLENTRCIPLD